MSPILDLKVHPMHVPRIRLRTLMIGIAFLALLLTVIMQTVRLQMTLVIQERLRADAEMSRADAERGRALAEASLLRAQATIRAQAEALRTRPTLNPSNRDPTP
jgi:NhaP-type Na+/H+ or K+/H+ antiporter